jgi:SAM-dependent methyltransferase
VEYEEAVQQAPPGWRHFSIVDVARLPDGVREREMARIPGGEPEDHIVRALFWTFVYHLEPERWDELARYEPIHPAVIEALPRGVEVGLDVAAGSGRLTRHLVQRCRRVVAVEPSRGLRAMLTKRLPGVRVLDGWAEALPVDDRSSNLTTACGAVGPDPAVLAELRRVTAPGGLIALINPEQPDWFEANGWRRMTAPPIEAPPHPRWIDEFFGPPDPPRHLLTMEVPS